MLNEIGVCSSSLWPYDPGYQTNFAIQPPSNCYAQASQNIAVAFNSVQPSLNQIKAVIRSGYPVEFGMLVFNYFAQLITGTLYLT